MKTTVVALITLVMGFASTMALAAPQSAAPTKIKCPFANANALTDYTKDSNTKSGGTDGKGNGIGG